MEFSPNDCPNLDVHTALADLVPWVVSTVAELDALPVDTVIKAASGAVLHRQRAELWTPCDDSKDQFYTAGVVECFRGPFTVLWVGGTE